MHHDKPAAGEKTTGTGTSIFSKDGAVGSMFNGIMPLYLSRIAPDSI